jgi:hypothetical protein
MTLSYSLNAFIYLLPYMVHISGVIQTTTEVTNIIDLLVMLHTSQLLL